jgi:NAD+ synthase
LRMKPEEGSNRSAVALIEDVTGWIRHQVKLSGAEGVLLGMSGGLDSSVTAVLCERALGPGARGLILPCHSNPQDEAHALLVAERFDISAEKIDLSGAFDLMVDILPPGDKLAEANLKPRLRMIALYYYANNLGYLVVGSGNKSELMVGYFTKYGDGAVDLLPLGGLYKTQVRQLATDLGIPQEIIDKPPSAGLWQGQTDEGELGISYEELDSALIALQGSQEDVPGDPVVERVRRIVANTQHKRLPIPLYEP